MRWLIVIGLLCVVASGTAAELGGWGGPMVMGMMPSFRALNDTLDAYNTRAYGGSEGPAFSGPVIFLGGQGSGMVEGVSIGGWGGGFFKEATGDSSIAFLGYGMGYGEFGYRFNIANVLLLGPMIEIGGGGVGLTVSRYRSGGFGEPGPGYDPFDESYNLGKGFVNIGAAVDVAGLLPSNPARTAFIGLNLKAGYMYTLYDTGWWDEYAQFMDAPQLAMSGPFVTLGVVFGGKTDTHFDDWGDMDDEDEWEGWD